MREKGEEEGEKVKDSIVRRKKRGREGNDLERNELKERRENRDAIGEKSILGEKREAKEL